MRAVIAAAMTLGLCGGGTLSAEPASQRPAEAVSPAAASALAQAPKVRRAPPRVIITPRRPAASIYPSPYPYAYPGPGYARTCTSWLEPEARPSGTVIVPRMHCWWVRS